MSTDYIFDGTKDGLSEDILEKETVRSSAAMNRIGYYNFNKHHFFFEADTLRFPDEADETALALLRHKNGWRHNATHGRLQQNKRILDE